jgi:hypothetical protein
VSVERGKSEQEAMEAGWLRGYGKEQDGALPLSECTGDWFADGYCEGWSAAHDYFLSLDNETLELMRGGWVEH